MSETDDLFVSGCDYEFRSLTIDDFKVLVNEVICNEHIEDGASLCFQIFYKILSDSIYKNTFNGEYEELHVLSMCISQLREANKFDSVLFLDHLRTEFITLPLEVVWWLHKNEVVYFLQYCDIMKPANLSRCLLNCMGNNKQHSIFVYDEIIQDLLNELLKCSNRPRTSIYGLHRSRTWSLYSSEILNNMVDVVLESVFHENSQNCINLFAYVQQLNKYLPRIIIQRFLKSALQKMMTHNVNDFDIYSAVTFQESWTSEKINPNLLVTLKEIFSKYCIMEDIVDVMEQFDDKINWQYTLSAVGVCVKESTSGSADAKAVAERFLKDSFKGGKIQPFFKCLLFIRHSCMEKNMTMDYETWYSHTFGMQSDFKSKYKPTHFKFVISMLIKLIPYEPKSYLKIQISKGLSAPLQCNSLIHDYKALCRVRLQELNESPTVAFV